MKKLIYAVAMLLAISACQGGPKQAAYSWENDLHQRLLRDFCLSEAQVRDYIRKYIPDVTDDNVMLTGSAALVATVQMMQAC